MEDLNHSSFSVKFHVIPQVIRGLDPHACSLFQFCCPQIVFDLVDARMICLGENARNEFRKRDIALPRYLLTSVFQKHR